MCLLIKALNANTLSISALLPNLMPPAHVSSLSFFNLSIDLLLPLRFACVEL